MADPVAELEVKLPSLISEASHSEIWSISLSEASTQRKIVLRKYLTAHKTVEAASAALLATLKWRKSFDPVKAISEPHDASKFGGLGYVTTVDASKAAEGIVKSGGGGRPAVITWNVYGAVKDHQKTFGNADEFIRWRVGLMERGVQALKMTKGDAPSDDIAIVQVHDYLNVSFFRLPAETRAATKKTIEVLSAHYPELLSRKYFVNVPVVMGWMFTATKAFLAKETVAKFQVLSYGNYIAAELGKEVPKDYGGEGAPLAEQDATSTVEKSRPSIPTTTITAAEEAEPTKTESTEAPAAA